MGVCRWKPIPTAFPGTTFRSACISSIFSRLAFSRNATQRLLIHDGKNNQIRQKHYGLLLSSDFRGIVDSS
jgi:hypothetical protein